MPSPCSSSIASSFCLDVSINSLFLTVPMFLDLALIAVIWGFGVNVEQNGIGSSFTIPNSDVNGEAYYVSINSTLLIFVASWMSSLAPLLSGYTIALATYPIAQRILRDTQQEYFSTLPSPYQLALAVKIISGSVWSGLWSLFMYTEGWKQRVARHSRMLASLAAVAIITICLSALVLAADTWLHIVTTTIPITIAGPLSNADAMYGLALEEEACTSTNNSFVALLAANTSCTISPAVLPPVLENGYAALEVLNNQSTNLSLLNTMTDAGLPLHYLSVAPSTIHQDHDFTADTFGILASCTPVTQACHLEIGDNSTFSCHNGRFYEDADGLTYNSLYPMAFRYPDYVDDGYGISANGVDNPLYFAAAFVTRVVGNLDPEIFKDPEVVTRDDYFLGVVLSCNLTVMDVTYDLIQGHAKRFELVPSDVSTTNALTSAVTTSTIFGFTDMVSSMNMAATVAKSAQEIADHFASLLSTTMLAGAAGSLHRTPSKAAQLRKRNLVTRVPKVPLFFLLGVNLCYPVMSIILTTLAVRTSQEERQAQHRLSVHGLVPHIFDKKYARLTVECVEELYEEFHDKDNTVRVGLRSTSCGGSKLQSCREMQSLRGVSNAVNGSFHRGHTTIHER